MRPIVIAIFAFLGLFAGAFSLWTAGNSIRWGVPLVGYWKTIALTVCPPVYWLASHTRMWPLLLLVNVLLYALLGYLVSFLLVQRPSQP